MKLPNGYGAVVNLGKKRRRPYAVRVTTGAKKVVDEETGKITYRQQYRYLAYFEKSAQAHDYLARINNGTIKAPEQSNRLVQPTFEEVYERWIDFRSTLKKNMSPQLTYSYQAAFGRMKSLHPLKISAIRLDDLQECINASADMSKSTVNNMLIVMHGIYDYALKYDMVQKDYSQFVVAQGTEKEEGIHKPFTDKEIELLWKHKDQDAAAVTLIMIYSGLRVTEFLQMRTENVHLDDRYMVGGIKTKAGKNRMIPINEKIVPLLARFVDRGNDVLMPGSNGRPMDNSTYVSKHFGPLMAELGLQHLTHDCKHTCASKLEAAGVSLAHRKRILGHSLKNDVTEGVYTHVSIEALIEDINRI